MAAEFRNLQNAAQDPLNFRVKISYNVGVLILSDKLSRKASWSAGPKDPSLMKYLEMHLPQPEFDLWDVAALVRVQIKIFSGA
jgi:hypothetical protein